MWRTRAVVSLLVEEVAGLDVPAATAPEAAEESTIATTRSLARACRRSRLVIALDGLALLLLFLLRDPSRSFLAWGPTVDTVFTLGALALAAHAGFRWAQLDTYRAVARACADLHRRSAL